VARRREKIAQAKAFTHLISSKHLASFATDGAVVVVDEPATAAATEAPPPFARPANYKCLSGEAGRPVVIDGGRRLVDGPDSPGPGADRYGRPTDRRTDACVTEIAAAAAGGTTGRDAVWPSR